MGNRIFQAVVLLLWGAAMSWLMVAKILPPFFQGEPPHVGTSGRLAPVAWKIGLQGRECGVAVSQAVPGASDTLELHSRVRLDNIPLPEDAPQWMLSLLKNLGEMRLDLRNQATFDSLGSLATFQTRVQVNDVSSVVKMTGRVRDGTLQLKMQTGDYTSQSEHPWREDSMLGGQLSPEAKLLNVYVGRRWREEVFSPFGAPGSPAELIEAKVEEEEKLLHRGELVRVKRIVYRSLAPAGVSAKDRMRATVWVRDDGVVLRQDSYFMNVCLRFDRLTDDESGQMADELLELDVYASTTTPDAPYSSRPMSRAQSVGAE